MKMNKDRLVVMSVQGSVDHPSMVLDVYRLQPAASFTIIKSKIPVWVLPEIMSNQV